MARIEIGHGVAREAAGAAAEIEQPRGGLEAAIAQEAELQGPVLLPLPADRQRRPVAPDAQVGVAAVGGDVVVGRLVERQLLGVLARLVGEAGELLGRHQRHASTSSRDRIGKQPSALPGVAFRTSTPARRRRGAMRWMAGTKALS